MRYTFSNIILLLFAVALISACIKVGGTGGKAEIHGHIIHDTIHIPSAFIYLKYDATEFPGTLLNVYDETTLSDTSGHYQFEALMRGDYYIYCVAYDSLTSEPVTGGLAIVIEKKKGETEAKVFVTE
ncbi:MAG: hypothetical protein IIA45_13685 [Bacteroidetes bacterium]|nr:hypothetical protein [Bacteroidota bacterium]